MHFYFISLGEWPDLPKLVLLPKAVRGCMGEPRDKKGKEAINSGYSHEFLSHA